MHRDRLQRRDLRDLPALVGRPFDPQHVVSEVLAKDEVLYCGLGFQLRWRHRSDFELRTGKFLNNYLICLFHPIACKLVN